MLTRRTTCLLLGLTFLGLSSALPILRVQGADEPAPSKAMPDRKALEKQFAQKLSGSVLVGQFTVDGQPAGKAPTVERYTINKITKLPGDYWLFEARIQYGGKDVTIPMTIEVQWAGDTPVITLSDTAIPPLGTFSSRVLFHGDRYAGTWQHDKVGGHMWGKVEKLPAEKPAVEKKAE